MKNQLYNFRIKNLATVLTSLLLILSSGCKKFVTVETPITSISTENVFKDESTATAALTGIYGQMNNNYFFGVKLSSISILLDLSADNLTLFDLGLHRTPDYPAHYLNQLTPKYPTESNRTWWRDTYAIMYSINFSIEQLKDNDFLDQVTRNRLLGEAYFLRAFHYFYLVNLYGGVPLVLTTQYKVNVSLPRSTETEVYSQIIADLDQAEGLLDDNYVGPDAITLTSERVRPNRAAVNALQARVYLYQKRYAEAEAMATKIINRTAQYTLANLGDAFLKNSKETIWALQSVTSGYNTIEASQLTIPATGPTRSRPLYSTTSLVNSFEPGDDRKNKWLGNVAAGAKNYYYPAKYKIPFGPTAITEYLIILRLSEQYLIRAEARNELNNVLGAIEDLNKVRARARSASTVAIPNPLPALSNSLSQVDIRSAIIKERRVELFSEWGHRWFDLKRTGNIDNALSAAAIIKANGANWASYKALFPIPVSEILLDQAIAQNPGYIN